MSILLNKHRYYQCTAFKQNWSFFFCETRAKSGCLLFVYFR